MNARVFLPALARARSLRAGSLLLLALAALLSFGWQAGAGAQPLSAAPAGCPAGPISGDISTDTTWTLECSPYQVDDFLAIEPGATLTIEPGVIVEVIGGDFNQISVQGGLEAIGTAAQPITFTSDEERPGSWGGMNLGWTAEQPASATLRHVIMEYGRVEGLPGDGILTITDATVDIQNSQFRNGGSNGIVIDGVVTGQISNTSFTGNGPANASGGGAALRVSYLDEATTVTLNNLSATGNLYNGVEYRGIHLDGTRTWGKTGIPYIISGGFFIEENGHLTIEPGVVVQARKELTFDLGTTFYVDGVLTAVGTEEEPILFTGAPGPGGTPIQWGGMNVSDNESDALQLELRHVILERGGDDGDSAAVLNINRANATVADSIIRLGGNDGVSISSFEGRSIQISNTSIVDNGRYPLLLSGGSGDPVLSNITTSGNGEEIIALDQPFLMGEHLWENIGLPYIPVTGNLGVGTGATLRLEPGVEVRFPEEGSFSVGGSLYAIGTAEEPVKFTGTTETAGWWSGIQVNESPGVSSVVEFQYCDIGYGGSTEGAGHGLLALGMSNVLVRNCRIHHSATAGIEVFVNSTPVIQQNSIEMNAMGVVNENGGQNPSTVDARNNWWGHASGPHHPTTNPDGQGNGVSDGVLYNPWLTAPPTGEGPDGLTVQMISPSRAQIGGVESFGVFYSNNTEETVQDAVLLVLLPNYAEYQNNSGGGIHWPQQRQLFWKLGALEPGETGLVSFQARFFSGLPQGLQDFAQAFLAGSNAGVDEFDVQPFLDYTPTEVESESDLTQAQVDAERAANPAFDAMYQRLLSEGYIYGSASRFTYNQGDPMTLVVLINIPRRSVAYLKFQTGAALVTEISDEYYIVRDLSDGGGGMRVNLQTELYELFGSWSSTGQFEAFSPTEGSFGECMKNCIVKLIPKHVVKNVSKTASSVMKVGNCAATYNGEWLAAPSCASLLKKIPGVSEGIDLGKCNSECQMNPKSHVCSEDLKMCGSYLGSWLGIDSIDTYECMDNGRYQLPKSIACPISAPTCKMGPNGPYCTTCAKEEGGGEDRADLQGLMQGELPSSGYGSWEGASLIRWVQRPWSHAPAFSIAPTAGVAAMASDEVVMALGDEKAESNRPCCDVVAAKDPNAKYGPTGDVAPGEELHYTITYENVGEGQAFDVFIMDPLSDVFDETTLVINDGGTWLPATRAIMWEIGTLAPAGQPGSAGEVTFSVRLRAGLPSGTVIVNQAEVHFPSVPEITPTDPVIAVVQPLAAHSQEVSTEVGVPVDITFTGRDVSGAALTYAVEQGPTAGTLEGTPPNVRYIPAPGFVGVDVIRFTVSNSVSTSRPADVEITVLPAEDDATAPAVVETTPANGGTLNGVSAAPLFSDTLGALYGPPVRIRFSEPLDPNSLENAILLSSDDANIPFLLAAEDLTSEILLYPRVPFESGVSYTVLVLNTVTDLRGNAMAQPHLFTFRARNAGPGTRLHLPAVMR